MNTDKMNQNLLALAISFGFLALSEYFKLPDLGKFALIATIATGVAYLITLIPYTKRYCVDHWKTKVPQREQREQREQRSGGQRPQHQRSQRPPQSTN